MKKFNTILIIFILLFLNLPTVSFASNTASSQQPNTVQAFDKTQSQLKELVGRLQQQLEHMKTQIQNLPEIDVQSQQSILFSLETYTNKVSEIKNSIFTATDNQGFKSLASQIHQIMENVRQAVKKYLSIRLEKHIQNFQTKKEQFLQRIHKQIERFKAKGVNTTSIQNDLQDYTSAMDEATQTLAQAKKQLQQFQNTKNSEEAAPIFRSSIELIHQGRIQAQNAKELTQKFTQKLKQP